MKRILLSDSLMITALLVIIISCGKDDSDGQSPSCPPEVSYGGQVYNTVKIGSQCWMKENLNIGTMINGDQEQTDNGIIEKYCYDNEEGMGNVYGGLYHWDEMMQYVTQEGTRGICPEGWHIPTDGEWSALVEYLGGDSVAGGKMKETETTHWFSTNSAVSNSSGFTALPAGTQGLIDFQLLSYVTYFWSSTEYDLNNAWFRRINHIGQNISRDYLPLGTGFSVRCIKDK